MFVLEIGTFEENGSFLDSHELFQQFRKLLQVWAIFLFPLVNTQRFLLSSLNYIYFVDVPHIHYWPHYLNSYDNI